MKGVFIPMEPGTGERARVRLEQLELGRYGGQGEIHLEGVVVVAESDLHVNAHAERGGALHNA